MADRGAPKGNNNAAKGKRWLNAIEKALEKRAKSDQQAALVELADKLLDQCAEGNLQALQELGNRLDGKPNQAITGGDGEKLFPDVIRIKYD